MADEKKRADSFRVLSFRGRFAKERQVNEASTAAREALAEAQRAAAELGRKCANLSDVRAKVTEAEGAIASVTDEAQRKKLEESLERARTAVEESERICRGVQRR